MAKKRQEQLDYINNQIIKEHKAEKRFTDLNSAMQQYFLITGRQLKPLPPKQFNNLIKRDLCYLIQTKCKIREGMLTLKMDPISFVALTSIIQS